MTITEADAVVVGAGAFGVSVAYHLAKLGAGRVVVLDRYAPGSQTSPRAAGLFKLIQADETRTRLARLSVQKVTHFEEETGVPLPVVRSGSLMLARTREHARMVEDEFWQSAAWGVDLELVDGAEAHRLMPPLSPRDIEAACHTPGDLYIEEPSALLQAYLRAMEPLGVMVHGHTPVTGVRVSEGHIVGVVTSEGEIHTPIVVDAAGAWARMVGELAGGSVPIVPLRHQLYITTPLAGIAPELPILRIVDTAVYVRPARGGLMCGGFEADPMPIDPRERGDSFSIDDVPLDMSVLDRLTATVEGQVPSLRDTALAEHRGGLFTMTPDGRFLAGPVPGVRGLWTATGCNGSGFSFSPAIGQVLAEWIVGGEPSIDIASLSPERFADLTIDEERLRDDCVWQYTHYYAPTGDSPST